MSNIRQETIFLNSGLNTDNDDRFMPLGDSKYRLNILVGEDYATGVITNMKGFEQATDIADHILNHSNAYVTVGSYYNRLTRKCYYFVYGQPYDSDGSGLYIYDNKLFCYNEDSNTLDLIFTDEKNYFGLSLDHLMKDCVMLEDWLYFNPKNGEPRMIDVVRAYNYETYPAYGALTVYHYGDKLTYYGGLFMAKTTTVAGNLPSTAKFLSGGAWIYKFERIGDAYLESSYLGQFDSEFHYAFNVIHQPPVGRLKTYYDSNTDISSNNVRGKLFRFSYRFKYFDNSYSVYAAYSDITLPQYDEKYNGEIENEITFCNFIRINGALHSPALIKEVEVVFQETGSDWKRAKVINRVEQGMIATAEFNYDFYNNESYMQVPNIEVG